MPDAVNDADKIGDETLAELIAEQASEAERYTVRLNERQALPHEVRRRLADARAAAAVAHARELARFIHDAERRRAARQRVNKAAAFLRQQRGV